MARETSLSDAEKIAYLLSSMDSEKALREAQVAAGACDVYEDVVQRSRNAMMPHVQSRAHANSLFKVPKISYNRRELLDGLSLLDICYASFERHDGATLKQLIPAYVETRRDDECLHHWNEYSATDKIPPTLERLRQFLQDRADTLPEDMKPRTRDKPRAKVLVAQGQQTTTTSSKGGTTCALVKETITFTIVRPTRIWTPTNSVRQSKD